MGPSPDQLAVRIDKKHLGWGHSGGVNQPLCSVESRVRVRLLLKHKQDF